MLSYDSAISLKGQTPASPVLSNGHQSIPPSPSTMRLPTSSLSNGVRTNGNVPSSLSKDEQRHIWLVTGPAGCGKSTVAKYLATVLHMPYIEGDEFHPQANIDKMSAGIPLTDADRWDWLTALREASLKELDRGNRGVVLTCSALKRKYRDVIRVAPYFSPNLHLHFIYLDASEELLLQRVLARKNHYMGANMVHSQFEVLEKPTKDEVDVISIDVSRPAEAVMAEALDRVLDTMDTVAAEAQRK
ncbi:P-loop containing nucleoside triphosphate hydrolase protein [Triangularia verruculosa]|uniref:Gluconokinase n=1 Tax=Triangularia verruculosa TaxID=2587418 RepID=A0AAN7AWS0_9PEZI|nr:P-loop containing nucleoside triphosphate hydrolase protein [Triangularia verruculosa]